jgi:hypothetical protein
MQAEAGDGEDYWGVKKGRGKDGAPLDVVADVKMGVVTDVLDPPSFTTQHAGKRSPNYHGTDIF